MFPTRGKNKSHLRYPTKQIQTFYKTKIRSTQTGTKKIETQQQRLIMTG